MESQDLKAKEMVEMLEACLNIGYQAVMQHARTALPASAPVDPVPVEDVDLSPYDRLYAREAVQ